MRGAEPTVTSYMFVSEAVCVDCNCVAGVFMLQLTLLMDFICVLYLGIIGNMM
jgi:hypothetical protein